MRIVVLTLLLLLLVIIGYIVGNVFAYWRLGMDMVTEALAEIGINETGEDLVTGLSMWWHIILFIAGGSLTLLIGLHIANALRREGIEGA